MKNVKKTILEIESEKHCFVINTEDQKLIKGGDGSSPVNGPIPANLVQLLFGTSTTKGIFDLSELGTTSAYAKIFIQEVTDLAKTTIGADVLNGLLNSKTVIKVSDAKPLSKDGSINTAALASYQASTNSMMLGNLKTDTSFDTNCNDFGAIAHELFHAYQNDVLKLPNMSTASVQNELDASLFAAISDVEFDIQANLSIFSPDSHISNDGSIPTGTGAKFQIASNVAAFDAAWKDVILNGNGTLANYNNLLNNFIGGSSYSVSKGTISSSLPLGVTSNNSLYKLFNADYSSESYQNVYKWMTQNPNSAPGSHFYLGSVIGDAGGSQPEDDNDIAAASGNSQNFAALDYFGTNVSGYSSSNSDYEIPVYNPPTDPYGNEDANPYSSSTDFVYPDVTEVNGEEVTSY
jgi:hypothetical protein